jgi:uncharacterized YccA/Bax inhibitor family protein
MNMANPALTYDRFAAVRTGGPHGTTEVMTIGGAIAKSGILVAITTAMALWVWGLVFTGALSEGMLGLFQWGGMIAGFILALVTIFKAEWSPVTAPLYAAAQGAFLGAFSIFVQSLITAQGIHQPIVVQAVFLTFGALLAMLALYQSRIITVNDKFRSIIIMSTGAIALVYFASIILSFFGIQIPLIHEGGPVGIGFSLLVVGIASFSLLLDFDIIERGASAGAPKFMEWYAGFGLLVTLIWLYLEFLRLLMKIYGSERR